MNAKFNSPYELACLKTSPHGDAAYGTLPRGAFEPVNQMTEEEREAFKEAMREFSEGNTSDGVMARLFGKVKS